MVQILSMWSVLTVLQKNPFNVNNLQEVADKFHFGVDVDDDDTVEGVDTASVRDCFDFLPTPASFQVTEKSTYCELFIFSDFGMMMTLNLYDDLIELYLMII